MLAFVKKDDGMGAGGAGVAYLVLVTWQVHGEVAVPRVPHLEGAVLAACDEQSAVGGPCALVDLWFLLSAGDVGAGCKAAISGWTVAYRCDVAPQTLEELAVPGVPEFLC